MSKEEKIINSLRQKPSFVTFKNFELPNNSGDHMRSIKRDTPINDADLVNKKYVDDMASPGGSNTNIQYNDGGVFAGDPTFVFNKATKIVYMPGTIISQVADEQGILVYGYDDMISKYIMLTVDANGYAILKSQLGNRLYIRTGTDNPVYFSGNLANFESHIVENDDYYLKFGTGKDWTIGCPDTEAELHICKSDGLGTPILKLTSNGVIAKLIPPAGTATAGTAPLKLTSGTNLTTAELGAIEFDGTNFYATVNESVNDDDTDSFSGSWVTGGTTSQKAGIRFLTNVACSLLSVTKEGSCTATTVALLTDAGSTIATASFSGDVATFSSAQSLTNATHYRVEAYGGTYTFRQITIQHPIDFTNWSSDSDSLDGGNNVTTNVYNIISLTTRTTSSSVTRKKFTLVSV